MEHSSEPVVTAEFTRRFEYAAADSGGVMTFARFAQLALYDAAVGYYRANRTRVGQGPGTDFYTSSTMRNVFGALIVAAVRELLDPVQPATIDFVEIGAEPGAGVLEGVAHPFRSVRTVRVGDPLEFPETAVVFSNELFDAQPFHRVVFRRGKWRELGVQRTRAGTGFAWTELAEVSPAVNRIAGRLPAGAPEEYTLDLPLAAEQLARTIAAASWRGVFLGFDYGRSWAQLTTDYPAGTGRAYAAHRQVTDLLASPGRQDLTCHVCWDWIENALHDGGFAAVTRESQEAFFIRRATAEIERLISGPGDALSPARTQLKQLLHPALLGQKFEALHAIRR